ncbi:S-layer homology domain-containing protein [Bacillus massiliigorillae]|uniref:S-layer homology domain-containing protein n=1 Tax=Bacillus massiliigorillae TaxID=1243664 RepID=UPI0003A65F50|nr:S-layer homology domain-containing protein [Bacillus massiliigorillae]
MAYQPKSYRKFVATAATATLVAGAIAPLASAASFTDVAPQYKDAVDFVVSKGAQGLTDTKFGVNENIKRVDAAVLLVKVLGLDIESAPASGFTDVPPRAVKYINALKAAGITTGKTATKFDSDSQIKRGELAIWIQRGFKLEGKSDVNFTDVAAQYTAAVGALVANDITKGKNATQFGTNDNAKRGDYAIFLMRADKATAGEKENVGTVKAINNTTVEVTYDKAITDENVKEADYSIEGLKITNAAVKQTDKKVVVLTTEAQEKDKEYTVKSGDKELGKFKGIEAVIPEKIDVDVKSLQGVVGKEVTLKAKVTVKEGQSKEGIPVTFNVDGNESALNKDLVKEVTTDKDGVATFSYTQYNAGEDQVAVYSTGNAANRSLAKVYWGVAPILTVDADEKTIDNGANRVYTAKYVDPKSGAPVANAKLNVTFKENLNDIDGSKTNDTTASIRKDNGTFVTPYQDSASNAGSYREEAFQVTTNSKGEATFTVTGKNTTATPIVFADANTNNRYEQTELQAVAGVAKFQGVQSPYKITFERTDAFVAALSDEYGTQNPIAYKLKVVTDQKDKDGNPLPYVGATIKVAIQENQDASLSNNTPAKISAKEDGVYDSNKVVAVTTNDKGEATVYLKSSVDNSKATPVAWIDLNAAGGNAGAVGNDKLEEGEPNAVAPQVTFLKSVVVSPNWKLNTPTAGAYVNGDKLVWKASLENQSGKPSETAGIKNATYTIKNTSNKVITINPRLVDANDAGYKAESLTITYDGATQTQRFVNGSAVTMEPGTTVTIFGVAPGHVDNERDIYIPSTFVPEYSSTQTAELKIEAPAKDGSLSVSSQVQTVRKSKSIDDTRNNNNTYYYDAKSAEFLVAEAATGTVTGEVIGYEVNDGKFGSANNFGRLVVKERHTGKVKTFEYNSATAFTAALDASFTGSDNALGNATTFETLLSVGDEVQTNSTSNSVRLFNEDKSYKSDQPKGNNGVAPDYTAIDAAITAAKAVNEAEYTEASYGALKTALAAAESARATGSQAQVDAATTALKAAQNALVLNGGIVKITSSSAVAPNSFALGLGLIEYKVEGTIASEDKGSVNKVNLVFSKADGTTKVKEDVAVVDGKVNATIDVSEGWGAWTGVKISYTKDGQERNSAVQTLTPKVQQ